AAEVEQALRLAPGSAVTGPAERLRDTIVAARATERRLSLDARLGFFYDDNVRVVPSANGREPLVADLRRPRHTSTGELFAVRALSEQGLRRGRPAAAASGGPRRPQLHGGVPPPPALRAGPPLREGRLSDRLGPDGRAELRVRRPPAERRRPVHATGRRSASEVRLRRAPARLPAPELDPADVRARHASAVSAASADSRRAAF